MKPPVLPDLEVYGPKAVSSLQPQQHSLQHRQLYEPTTVNAAIGMLRVYDSAGPTGGSPPQRKNTSGYGNL